METYPRCFDNNEQYQAWKSTARLTQIGVNGYCEDCTIDYQSEMIQRRRCAYPSTTFITDEDGIRGVRSVEMKQKIKNSSDAPKKTVSRVIKVLAYQTRSHD